MRPRDVATPRRQSQEGSPADGFGKAYGVEDEMQSRSRAFASSGMAAAIFASGGNREVGAKYTQQHLERQFYSGRASETRPWQLQSTRRQQRHRSYDPRPQDLGQLSSEYPHPFVLPTMGNSAFLLLSTTPWKITCSSREDLTAESSCLRSPIGREPQETTWTCPWLAALQTSTSSAWTPTTPTTRSPR